MERKHTVSVLFSSQKDRGSRALYWITGRNYTHASIRLDEMGNEFYSFNFKGMCTEKPYYFNDSRTNYSMLYQLNVSEDCFQKLQASLTGILQERESYRYNALGVALCLFHIPHKFERSYFCSQFVAELLKEANAIPQGHKASLCLPNRLEKELRVSRVAEQAVLNPFRTEVNPRKQQIAVQAPDRTGFCFFRTCTHLWHRLTLDVA